MKSQFPIEKFDVNKLANGIQSGDIVSLAKAITLIESSKKSDRKKSNSLLERCISNKTNSIRIGITGVPGVGKSTFIESFGTHLSSMGKKLAVLAVDPSSSISNGSILGDKTRMENLVRNPNVFIRPTPAGAHLGGVANKTRESILLCESAGYDIIIIETVGVGQSEISVYEMVDYFVLLKLSGAGDELQGIKRGIIEMADSIIINKADGQNKKAAELAKAEFKLALSLYPLKSSRWKTKISTCSSLNSVGVKEIWEDISNYIKLTKLSGYFQKNRNNQKKYWLMQTIKNTLHHEFFSNTTVKKELDIQIKLLESNKTSVIAASEKILNLN